MEKLEERAIPGVTAKGLIWFFGGVIVVIISVVLSAAGIKSDMRDYQTVTAGQISTLNYKLDELRQKVLDGDSDRRTIQLQMQSMQLQIARLEEKLGFKNYK